MRAVRCAIYTRKSSDEGLEQSFNSLDAQREACAAYILSQASEAWVALPEVYDDGGLSGGTLERPALQRLLTEVRGGRVDIIVVYKVDRLTRSLLDFSRLVEAFDAAGTSFVSVPQSFNTTTSMGRVQAWFDRLFSGWRLAVLPGLWFAILRVWLLPHFPETHGLLDDWYSHLAYVSMFTFGFALARSPVAWATVAKVWPFIDVVALLAWAVTAAVNFSLAEDAVLADMPLAIVRVVRTVAMWSAILALLRFAQRYANRDHPWRATLTEAVFPAYIAHQTIILVAEYWLRPLALGGGLEFSILLAATAAGSALFYMIVRPIRWLRPLAGLR